jgi:hypothetical protein
MEREVEVLRLGPVLILDAQEVLCVCAFAEDGENPLLGESYSNSHSSSGLGNRL